MDKGGEVVLPHGEQQVGIVHLVEFVGCDGIGHIIVQMERPTGHSVGIGVIGGGQLEKGRRRPFSPAEGSVTGREMMIKLLLLLC